MGEAAINRDINLLFGVFATQMRKVTPGQVMEVAGAWVMDPSRDLATRLVESGVLSEHDSGLIRKMVEEVIAAHEGDASRALRTFGGQEAIENSFGSSLQVQVEPWDSLSGVSAGTGTGDLHPASTGASSTEPASGEPPSADVFSPERRFPGVREAEGRYTRQREHASGGMGRVLVVHDESLGRDIAFKELLGGAATGSGKPDSGRTFSTVLARFLQEARITSQLEHPSIVPVYELGQRADGTPYYTMKLVRGRALSDVIEEAGTLEKRLELLPHFVDLCQAIAYAHSRHVIHRDIKPANVMVGEFGETVVIDWGLAKHRESEELFSSEADADDGPLSENDFSGGLMTGSREILGTPMYAPPEQLLGRRSEIDERSDVYSLGATLYTLLTGKGPFSSESLLKLIQMVLKEEPQAIESLETEAPPELIAICRRAMAKDRSGRYPSAAELAQDVQRFLSGALVGAHHYEFGDLARRFIRRHKTLIASAAGATLLLFAVAGISYARVRAERNAAVNAREAMAAARQEELVARRMAERESYRSQTLLAGARIDSGRFDVAEETLWNTDRTMRGWEWGYLMGLCHQDLRTLRLPFGQLLMARVSPDGRRLLTLALNDSPRIWDLSTGELHQVLTEESGRSVYLENLLIDELLPEIQGQFSQDGSRVLTRLAGKVRVWDVATGEPLWEPTGHSEDIYGALLSRDGQKVMTWSRDRTALLHRVGFDQPVLALRGHDAAIISGAFSPDESLFVTGSDDQSAKVWRTSDGQLIRTLSDHAAPVNALAFNTSGTRMLAAGEDGTVRVSDTASWEMRSVLEGHRGSILNLSPSPAAEEVATVSSDGTLRIFDLETGRTRWALSHGYRQAVFSPRGDVLFALADEGPVDVLDAYTGEKLKGLTGHSRPVSSIDLRGEGEPIVTASMDNSVKLWDGRDIHRRDRFQLSESLGLGLTFSPLEPTAAVSTDAGTVLFIDTRSGQLETTFEIPEVRLTGVDYSRDGLRLALSGDDPVAQIWDVGTWKAPVFLVGHSAAIASIQLSPDGRSAITASTDGTARVWDLDAGETGAILNCEAPANWAAFNADATRCVTAAQDGRIRVWDASTGALLKNYASFEAPALFASFAPGEPEGIIATSEDRSVRLWRGDEEGATLLIRGHSGPVTAARFLDNGRRLVTGSTDGVVKVWNAEGGSELAVLRNQGRAVHSLVADAAGRMLGIASGDGGIQFYGMRSAIVDERQILDPDGLLNWKRSRGAEFRPEDSRSTTIEHVVAIDRNTLRQQLRFLGGFLTQPGASSGTETEPPVLPELPRLGIGEGDRLVEFQAGSGEPLRRFDDAEAALGEAAEEEAIRAVVMDPAGRYRPVHYAIYDRAALRLEMASVGKDFLPPVQTTIPALPLFAPNIVSYYQQQASLPVTVTPDNLVDGLLVPRFDARNEREQFLLDRITTIANMFGVLPGDQVKLINGYEISSFSNFQKAIMTGVDEIKAGRPYRYEVTLDRGRFLRVVTALAVDP